MARLVGLVLVQAAALAGAAVATRAAFGALHAGTGLPAAVLLGFVASGLVAAWAQLRLEILAERMAQDFAGEVRAALFEHASRSRQSDLDRRRFGYLLLRFTGDLAALGNWPGRGLPRIVQAVVLLPAAIAVLHWLHPAFGLVGLGLVALIVCAAGPALPGLFRAHATLRKSRAVLAADMAERIPVAPQLAAYGRRRKELAQLSGRVATVSAAAEDRRSAASVLRLAPEAATAFAGCLILWLGSDRAVSAATIAAALAALALVVRPLGNLASALNHAAGFRASHRSLVKALARPVQPTAKGANRITRSAASLFIGMGEDPPIEVPAGAAASLPPAIFGPLVQALTGRDPAGALDLRLNGVDVGTLSPGSLRRAICHVTDTPLILKGSIRKNLTLALRKRPSDACILDRIAAAGMTPALARLGGLDRSLAERGAELDTDDRMALCLLRVAVQRPALVLHDGPPCPDAAAILNRRCTIIHASGEKRDAARRACRR